MTANLRWWDWIMIALIMLLLLASLSSKSNGGSGVEPALQAYTVHEAATIKVQRDLGKVLAIGTLKLPKGAVIYDVATNEGEEVAWGE